MLFNCRIPVSNGVLGADPLTSPGSVLQANLVNLTPLVHQQSDNVPNKLLLSFLAGTGETCTVSVWAIDEATLISQAGPYPTAAQLAARKFYRIATGLVLTNGILQEVANLVPVGGWFYVQVTATSMAGTGTIGVAPAHSLSSAGPPPPPPSPDLISGLQLWLRGDTLTQAAGSVSQIDNRVTGTPLWGHFVQANPLLQPLYNAIDAGLNGQPSWQGNATQRQRMTCALPSGPAAATLYLFQILDSDPSAVNSTALTFGGSASFCFYTLTSGEIYDDFGSTTRRNANPTPNLAAAHCYSAVSKSGSWKAYINGGTPFISAASNTVGWANPSTICASVSFNFRGRQAECIVYDKELSAPEQAIMAAYALARYNVTIAPFL